MVLRIVGVLRPEVQLPFLFVCKSECELWQALSCRESSGSLCFRGGVHRRERGVPSTQDDDSELLVEEAGEGSASAQDDVSECRSPVLGAAANTMGSTTWPALNARFELAGHA